MLKKMGYVSTRPESFFLVLLFFAVFLVIRASSPYFGRELDDFDVSSQYFKVKGDSHLSLFFEKILHMVVI